MSCLVVVLLVRIGQLQQEIVQLREERDREAELAIYYRHHYRHLIRACARGPPTRPPPPLPDYEHLTF